MGNWSNGFQLGVPAIRSRLKMGHLSWKYQVDGFIYYQLFAWEPYCEEPWRSCTAVGTTPTLELTDFMNDKQTWDGEGQLAVPGPDGVLATLHLESVRDGCEYSNGLSPLLSSDADRCCHQTKITSCTGCRTSCAAHPPPATCRLPSQGRCRTASVPTSGACPAGRSRATTRRCCTASVSSWLRASCDSKSSRRGGSRMGFWL